MVTQQKITSTFSRTSTRGLPLNWEQIAMPINEGTHTATVSRNSRRPTLWVSFMSRRTSSARCRKCDLTAAMIAAPRSCVSSSTGSLMTRFLDRPERKLPGTASTVWKILSSARSERSRLSSGDGSSPSKIWATDLNDAVPLVVGISLSCVMAVIPFVYDFCWCRSGLKCALFPELQSETIIRAGEYPSLHRNDSMTECSTSSSKMSPEDLLIVLVVALGSFMAGLDATIVNIALPDIAKAFDVSTVAVSWVLNAYLIILVSLLLAASRLGDMKGYRSVFIGGFALFTTGSLLCGLSPTLAILIISRMVQAVGGAVISALGAVMVTSYLAASLRGQALGIVAMFTMLGAALGPVVGG